MSWASELAEQAASYVSRMRPSADSAAGLKKAATAFRESIGDLRFGGIADRNIGPPKPAPKFRATPRQVTRRGLMTEGFNKPAPKSTFTKATERGRSIKESVNEHGRRAALKLLGAEKYTKLFGTKGVFSANGSIGSSEVFKNAVSAGKNFGSGFMDGTFSTGMTRSIGAGALGGAIGGLGGAARSAYNGDLNGSDGWGFVKSVGQGAFLGGAVGLAHSGLTGLAKTQAVSSSAWQNVGKFAEKTTNWTNSKTMRGAVTVAAAMNGYGSMTSPVNKHHRVKR